MFSPKLTSQLPAVLVTPSTHDRVVQIAEDNKVSRAQVIRAAIDLFLQTYDSSPSGLTSKPALREEQVS